VCSSDLTFFLISLLIGLFTGFAMASGYTAYFSATFPIHASPIVSFELPLQLLLLLSVYLLVFLAPSIYAMKKPIRVHAH
jgi:membrane protein implicated in regulation of membrane protease activity